MVTTVQDGDTGQNKMNVFFQEEIVLLFDLNTVGANSRIFLVDVQKSSSHVARKQVLEVHKCE